MWSTILLYSYGSAYIDDYLLQFVPELTKEVYVVTNELKTKCRCQQAPGLAVQEFCGVTPRTLHAIPAKDGE